MLRSTTIPWQALAELLLRDPAGRGFPRIADVVCPTALELKRATESLVTAGHVAIVTGFPIPCPGRVAPETDGPLGALALARALGSVGAAVSLVSDAVAAPVLATALSALALPEVALLEMPMEPSAAGEWAEEFLLSRTGRPLTHLVAIERAGPGHSLASLATLERSGPIPSSRFESAVPLVERQRCRNMSGEPIEDWMAPTHLLFDLIQLRSLPIVTVGVADGGNEIGCGKIPWETLASGITTGSGALIACRVPTDCLISCGVSNWGGHALAACLLASHTGPTPVRGWSRDDERMLLERIVAAGAVDGVTRAATPTVDGLTLDEYYAIPEAIWRMVS